MAHSNDVSLDVATKSDDALLSNLLELYMHDLSAVYPNIEMGADGRFGYPNFRSIGPSRSAASRF